MKLVSTFPWREAHIAHLRATAPDLEVVCAGSAITSQQGIADEDWARELPLFLAAVADADIVVGHFGSTVERLTAAIEARLRLNGGGGIFLQLMRAAGHRVRWVHCTSAGVEKLLYPEVLTSPAILTCGKGEVAGSLLAETVMGRVLLYTRGLLPAIEARSWEGGRAARWSEVRGMTMGIVGFGGAGAALAKLALAFGMDVIATRRHPTPPPAGVRALWGPDRLHDLLRQADVVALTLPSTPETRGMIGLPEFHLMKRTAILVNVGRGDLIQGEALVTALREELIAFAALDVLPWPEPWGPDMPLWRMKNALITPHVAAVSSGRMERTMQSILDNIGRFVRGEPLLGQVDKVLQY